jgi:lipid-binding SYLF domain-containing protein
MNLASTLRWHCLLSAQGLCHRRSAVILFLTAIVFPASNAAPSARPNPVTSKEMERLHRASQVFAAIMNAPDQTLPRNLLDRSECVAVIPSMLKGGLVFGGRYGRGVVSCRKSGGAGEWGPPSMLTLGGGSFGLQFGGASVDVLMLVLNPSGIQKLLQDKFTLGGDASAAAGPVGRAATAETDAQMNAKILTYSRSRGVFAGLELEGAVLMQDRDGNRSLYGRPVDARELLLGGNTATPPAAREFTAELSRLSPRRSKNPL